MSVRTKEKVVMAAVLISVSSSIAAQESEINEIRPVQITFAYPLGSNGINSMDYSNIFSLNLLYGLNGGVSGAELGGIINFDRGDVKGVQMSGVANINVGYTRGIQMAGVLNLNDGITEGVQLSGVFNFNTLETSGIQLGTVNVALKELRGIQAGVVNVSREIRGIQLGVVNILGSPAKALPVGLLSIVRYGHYELEITGGEVIYMNLNYKMGVEKFYTLFKAGMTFYNQEPVYSAGIGFGGMLFFGERGAFSIDLSENQIIYKNNWTDDVENMLTKLDFNFKYGLTPNFFVLIGPSANLYLTKKIIDGKYGTLNLPYHIFSNESTDARTRSYFWVGLNAGFSIKF